MRRAPEEARALILAAAEHLFAEKSPDVVGLKDVARAGGVSHALVSHYFGTYDALVEAVLERRINAFREHVFAELVAAKEGAPVRELLDRLWAVAKDPVTLRVGAWALLSGRMNSDDFFAGRVQGLRLIADAVERLAARDRRKRVPRGDIEFVLMAGAALTYGYAIMRVPLQAGLGRPISPDADADFRARVAELLERYLARSR